MSVIYKVAYLAFQYEKKKNGKPGREFWVTTPNEFPNWAKCSNHCQLLKFVNPGVRYAVLQVSEQFSDCVTGKEFDPVR